VPEQGDEPLDVVILEARRSSAPVAVGQGLRPARLAEAGDPIVDRLPGDAERPGDVGDCAAGVDFKEGQAAAIGVEIGGLVE
jgi:hypothetical protein